VKRFPSVLVVLALLAAALLPWVADRLRGRGERCELDGVDVARAFRVRVFEKTGTVRSFCGVGCAQTWLERSGVTPQKILVTDCVSGREFDARTAWYVHTVAAWGDGAPDSIRVFARISDAERHVEAYGGSIVPVSDRPFGHGGKKHVLESG